LYNNHSSGVLIYPGIIITAGHNFYGLGYDNFNGSSVSYKYRANEVLAPAWKAKLQKPVLCFQSS